MTRVGIFRALTGLGLRDPNILYPATVLSQHSDGRIDVRCDDAALGDWSKVRVWSFAPQVKVLIAAKTRVLVGFAGVLKLPFALAYSGAGLEGIEIGTNTKRVARLGDTVRVTMQPGTVIVQTTSGSASNLSPIIANGEITSGSSVVKIQ